MKWLWTQMCTCDQPTTLQNWLLYTFPASSVEMHTVCRIILIFLLITIHFQTNLFCWDMVTTLCFIYMHFCNQGNEPHLVACAFPFSWKFLWNLFWDIILRRLKNSTCDNRCEKENSLDLAKSCMYLIHNCCIHVCDCDFCCCYVVVFWTMLTHCLSYWHSQLKTGTVHYIRHCANPHKKTWLSSPKKDK